MQKIESRLERDYRSAYMWYLRNRDDPAAYSDQHAARAAHEQSAMAADRLLAARGRAIGAGLTAAHLELVEAEVDRSEARPVPQGGGGSGPPPRPQ